jgi:uncharacterized membrane protein YfcA
MMHDSLPLLTMAILVVAFLYSCVGHAGASGYIAVMTLFALSPAEIKPTALILNILVASIGTWQFWRVGHFSASLFWPFAVLAIPMAFLGGYLNLPTQGFKILMGLILLFSGARFFWEAPEDSAQSLPSKPLAISIGAGLGLLSGLTGTGGGIFLTPLLLFMRWAKTKNAAAVSALFILVNSSAGLLGNFSGTRSFPTLAIPLALAAILGGSAGSFFGSRRLHHTTIKRILALVLWIAGSKLMFAQ